MAVTRGLVSAVVAAGVVLLGCWVTGGLLTDDATTAMVLTGGWFTVSVGAALLAARRWGRAAWPGLVATVVTASLVGGWLLLASRVDRVVDEPVLAVPSASAASTTPAQQPPAPAVTRVSAGSFTSGAHETRGTATLLRRADGRLVLTMVGFETAAGPDLRVQLVPAGAKGVEGGTDVGALKGNKGDQKYAVPSTAPTARVVIWCRAFSVSFGAADLRA
ncbi:MAG: DM13 domain-containing protein [Frankiaceae bacterium]|nr:DM13 domain-containing protein [Frankiaceae bacterium]